MRLKRKILAHGGKVAMAKYALPGMAWQGYYTDTEGNVFGIHQPDETAKIMMKSMGVSGKVFPF